MPTLLILAAGIGSRFGGAKQVTEIGPNGETIMEYSMYDALNNGFKKIVLIINKKIESDIKVLLKKTKIDSSKIELVYQDLYFEHISNDIQSRRLKPWGTAHAILAAEKCINTPFSMINADDFYGVDAFKTMSDFFSTKTVENNNYSIVGYDLVNTLSKNGTVSRGILQSDSKGYLASIIETNEIYSQEGTIFCINESGNKVAIGEGLVSMNFWGFHPNLFTEIHKQFVSFLKNTPDLTKNEFQIPMVIDTLIKSGKIKVSILNSNAKWFGVTYKKDLPIVVQKIKEFAEEKKYPNPLWS